MGFLVILILINGCCVVLSLFVVGIENFVDVNLILFVVIECIDIFVIGVLVIYGVDVVVGVINYIFKDDF